MTSRVRAYLAQKRALGFKLKSEGLLLLDFARFADRKRPLGPLNLQVALGWATRPKSCDRLYHARRLEVVRTFAKHLAVEEPRTVVPPRHLLGPAHRRAEPFIYSSRQIRQLMRKAGDLGGTLRCHTTRTLVGLLASTGLRISEALNLLKSDVDLVTGVITVRESKFRKTRFVPLHRTTTRALQIYARRRDKLWPLADSFFVSIRGTRWSGEGVAVEVIALWLGHERPTTTHGYVEASLSMKKQALKRLKSPMSKRKRFVPSDALLSFLDNL